MNYGPPQGGYPQQYPPQQQQRPAKSGGGGCLGACLAALCCCCVAEEGCEACADCAGTSRLPINRFLERELLTYYRRVLRGMLLNTPLQLYHLCQSHTHDINDTVIKGEHIEFCKSWFMVATGDMLEGAKDMGFDERECARLILVCCLRSYANLPF